jgi:hypothetical protein
VSDTYTVMTAAEKAMAELLAVARGVVAAKGDEAGVVASIVARGTAAHAALRAKAVEIRPSAGYVAWNRGNAAALAHYSPTPNRPQG